MTIFVDCRWLDSSGIGVYIRECLPYFLNYDHTFFLLGDAKKLEPLAAGKKNVEIIECRVKPFSLKELFFFPKTIIKKINSGGIYYSPYFNIPGSIKAPVFTTIHDIIFPDMPELTSKTGLAARMWFYKRAFKRSKKIFTVSEFSKSRIEYYSKNLTPVIVTHSAIQPWIQKKRKPAKEKKKHIIFIGNIKKHKGLSDLIKAFLTARSEGLDHKLIIIGSGINLRSADKKLFSGFNSALALSSSIEFTGFLSDEKLLELLSEASLLVQPSLYEGFCLPPLEAMTAGTPALVSDIPVLKEIYRDYPLKEFGKEFPVYWFKAGDVNDLKEKLLFLLRGKEPGKIRLPRELENLYTFEKTSRTILDNLEKE